MTWRMLLRRFLFLFAALFALPLLACGGSDGTVGESCENDAVCEAGLTCRQDFPGTFCAQSCSAEGQSASCPEGTVCIQEFTDDFMCSPGCASDGDCREGYACTAVAGQDSGACRVRIQ